MEKLPRSDYQLVVRIPAPLRGQLQELANADLRPLASLARAVLTEFVANHTGDRAAAAAGTAAAATGDHKQAAA